MLVAKVDIRVPAEYFVEVLWKFLGIFSTDKQLILNEKMAEVHGNRTHPGRYRRPTPDLKSGSFTRQLRTSESDSV